MRVENTMEVPASLQRSWELIQDVPRIAPCIPGAELTEIVGDDAWKGKVHIRVGPIVLQFLGDIVREEKDEQTHRMLLKANGSEAKGRGYAEATIEVALAETGDATEMTTSMEVDLQGTVAQYGRGVVADITNEILRQFATRLAQLIRDEDAGAGPAANRVAGEATGPAPTALSTSTRPMHSEPPKPVGGLRLVLKAVWKAIVRAIRPTKGQRASR